MTEHGFPSEDTRYNPWDSSVKSVRQRFENVEGRMLQDVVRRTYVTEVGKVVPFFRREGPTFELQAPVEC